MEILNLSQLDSADL